MMDHDVANRMDNTKPDIFYGPKLHEQRRFGLIEIHKGSFLT